MLRAEHLRVERRFSQEVLRGAALPPSKRSRDYAVLQLALSAGGRSDNDH